ncbi:MAG: transcriptional repressor NrdR [Hyphomonadaceae bacterium]|nr:transcriptional repressor NrdR [Hyphomonadaceae bacterium]MBC6411725.1 transcriptional repressor NrdR [Hyphomonadaceae bacterium]
MRCPFCNSEDTLVKDSRQAEDGAAVRRRRLCNSCAGRFTTFERVQLRELTVIKRTGKRMPFERDKLTRSIQIALQKRNINPDRLEQMVSGIIRQLESSGNSDVTSQQIGELVMQGLAAMDSVAYVRYASVYRDFKSTEDFDEFIVEEKLGRSPDSKDK